MAKNKVRLLFTTLVVGILLISLVFFYLSMDKPYIGVVFSKEVNGWIVKEVDTGGLASKAGIVTGDIPEVINNQQASDFLDKYEHSGLALGYQVSQITVSNSEKQLISVTVDNSKPSQFSVIEAIIIYVICLCWWIAGFYVYNKRPNYIAARLFCLCSVVMSLVLVAKMAATRGIPIANYVEPSITIIGVCILIHFFIILPEERAHLINKSAIYLLYIPALITLIILFILGFMDVQPVRWFRTLRLFEYGLGLLGSIVVVFINYFKAKSIRSRQQTIIVLIGCLIGLLPIILLNVLPQAFWQHPIILPEYSILFLVFIPFSIAYAVVTKKLMEIDFIVRRSIIYSLIVIGMAMLLGFAMYITTNFHSSLNIPGQIVVTLILGGLAAALFGPVRKGIENLVDKLFYKDRFDYRKIVQSLSSSLSTINDFPEISRLIVGTLVNTLNLKGACLFAFGMSGTYEVRTAQGSFATDEKQKYIASILSKFDPVFAFPKMAQIDPDISFIIPLAAAGKQIGILCLSPKANKQSFSPDDLYLLQEVTSVAAIALHRTLLSRDVSQRDTFVSIASHEIRTPLTSILGYTELMLQNDPPKEQREKYLKYILLSGERLNTLVNDLLNVSRIQSGKYSINKTIINVPSLLKEIISLTNGFSETYPVTVKIDSNIPSINSDHEKLSQVLGNLLNNSIKYSLRGPITIAADYDDKKRAVIFSVADKGIGISQEDQYLLFQPFFRINRPETEKVKGNGLGLYIAKEWVEILGGKIWLQSEINQGSTFFVSIPVNDDLPPDTNAI